MWKAASATSKTPTTSPSSSCCRPLTIFALTLFLLRFLAPMLRALAWLIQLTNSVGLLIVTRQLERSPGAYYLPLILLVSTISLGIYTASFARTIDRYLYEQQYYRVSADVSVRVFSQNPSALPGGGGAATRRPRICISRNSLPCRTSSAPPASANMRRRRA